MRKLRRSSLFIFFACALFIWGLNQDTLVSAATKTKQAEQENVLPFTDVDPNSWSYSSIVTCYKNGWISGMNDKEFAPKGKLTRAQFITILGRYAKVDDKDPAFQKSKFTDVDFQSWGYAPYVAWAEQNGIASGTSETTFRPNQIVTRAQIAVFFYNYVHYKKGELVIKTPDITFSDNEEIPDYAKKSVEELAKSGVISGAKGKILPKEACTREMYAAFLVKFDLALKKANYAPEEPTIDTLQQIKGGAVQIDWHTKGKVTTYWIYRKKKEDKNWEKIASTKDVSWLDKGAKSGITYDYCIRACNYTGTSYLWSDYGHNKKTIEVKPYDSNYEEIDPSMLPFNNNWVNSKWYNDATKNYYLIQSYLDYLESIGGGTLVLNKGTYSLPYTVTVASNITIKLKDGVTVNQTSDVGTSEVKPSTTLFTFINNEQSKKADTIGGYEGVSNSKIIGEGSAQVHSDISKNTLFLCAHTKGIQLSNIKIVDNGESSYPIKLIGSQNTQVDSCNIQSNNNAQSGILINAATQNTAKPAIWCKMDDTVNQSIKLSENNITGCQYGIRTTEAMEKSAQLGISIDNCSFTKLSKKAVWGLTWKDATIMNSTFTSIGNGAVSQDKGGVNAIELFGSENCSIKNNKFDLVSRALYLAFYKFEDGTVKEPIFSKTQLKEMENTNQTGTLEKYSFFVAFSDSSKNETHYFADTTNEFTLTETSTPYKNRYDYTEATRIYYTMRSYLDQIEENGGGTITVKPGVYSITNLLYIPSNTKIRFEDNVTINKTGDSTDLFALANRKDVDNKVLYHSYEGVHDVSLTAPENSNVIINNQYRKGTVLEIGHTKNVTVSNIKFKNMYTKHHFIELDASMNTTITGCEFTNGTIENGEPLDGKEAINLDVPDPNTGGFSGKYSSQDCTLNDTILIQNNDFSNIAVAIGTHMYTPQSPHKNVRLLSNTIENCSQEAIKIMNWESPIIQGNTIKSIGNASDAKNDGMAFKIKGITHPTITNNTVSDTNYIAKIDMLMYGDDSNDALKAYDPVYNTITEEEKRLLQTNKTLNVRYNQIYYRNDNADHYDLWNLLNKKE